jgi:hypothetical protein
MSESGFARARREWGGAVMSWFRVWVWLAVRGLGGVAASTYFSSGYRAGGQTVIVVSCTAGALVLGLVTSFFLVWMSVVKIQPYEARSAYLGLQERDGFGTINQFKFRLWSFARDTGSIPFSFEIGK